MRKLFILIFLLCFCSIYLAYSQAVRPLRIEIAAKEDTDPYVLINCNAVGALVFFQTIQEVGSDSLVWSFYMFNKNLKESWKKGIGIGKNYTYADYFRKANDSIVFLIFQDKRSTEGENTVILTVNVMNGTIFQIKAVVTPKSKIEHFAVDDGYAFITLAKNNGDIELNRISFKTNAVLQFVVPDYDKSYVLDMKLNPINRHVELVNKVYESRTSSGLILLDYSYDGVLINSIVIDKFDSKRSINTAEVVFPGGEKVLIFGVYGNTLTRPKNNVTSEDQNPTASGYYAAGFDNGQVKFISYYNFSEFRDFIRYINGDDAVRLKKKNMEKNKSNEARESDLNYHLLVHPVILSDSSYVLTGEAFYPEYHTVTNMMYDYYGRPTPTSYSVFDGYRYTSAFVASFDDMGVMRWSNGMEMQGILTNFLNRKVSCTFDGKETLMIYNTGGLVTSKITRGEEVIQQNTAVPIAMLHANDKVVKEYLSTIEPWYGDFFIAYGYQSIRNNDLSDSRRNVFYINKIAYR